MTRVPTLWQLTRFNKAGIAFGIVMHILAHGRGYTLQDQASWIWANLRLSPTGPECLITWLRAIWLVLNS